MKESKATNKNSKVMSLKTLTLAAFTGLVAFGGQVYGAEVNLPNPTLDSIKSSELEYLNDTHNQYELLTKDKISSEELKNYTKVTIEGEEYYFKPNKDDTTVSHLVNTGSSALIETNDTSKAVFSADGKYYTYDTDKLVNSSYTLSEGSAEKYTFSYKTADTDGKLSENNNYYNVNIKDQYYDLNGKLSSSDSITWEEVDSADNENTISVKFSDNVIKISGDIVKHYTYKYTNPGYEATNKSFANNYTTEDVKGKLFSGAEASSGGAIYNSSNRANINIVSDFVGNKATNGSGGAINNNLNSMGNIIGNFIRNTATSCGSAIYNYGNGGTAIIGNISGDFIANSSQSGGAIYNNGDWGNAIIGNITGNFIGNTGGAIYNEGYEGNAKIENISGNFISNTSGQGAAIKNFGGTIGNVKGDFIGNFASDSGGAIYQDYQTSKMGDITGNFIGNHSNSNGGGIALYMGTIGNITGHFISNFASSDGGAIRVHRGTIGNITGDFIGNFASQGGAIKMQNDGTIGNITGDFIGNYSTSGGGAIYTFGIMGDITGNFFGNHTNGTGGAIYSATSSAVIGDITGDFIGNYSGGGSGAIWNCGTIGNITGNFISNESLGSTAGAIYNDGGTIGNITGNFIGNTGASLGGAIYNNGKTGIIKGDFIGNFVYKNGFDAGAIYNCGTIKGLEGNFIGNYLEGPSGVFGGAIYNSSSIGYIKGDFINNYASTVTGTNGQGGAIYFYGPVGNITGNFINNYVSVGSGTAQGGALYFSNSSGLYGEQDKDGNVIGGIINSSFINNRAIALNDNGNPNPQVLGGAIYTNADLNIIADNGLSEFTGNYIQNGKDTEKDYQAIWVNNSRTTAYTSSTSVGNIGVNQNGSIVNKTLYRYTATLPSDYNPTTLTLKAVNNGTVVLNDKISGTSPIAAGSIEVIQNKYWSEWADGYAYVIYHYLDENNNEIDESQITKETYTWEDAPAYAVNITGDESGKVYLNNNIENSPYVTLTGTNLYLGKRDDVLDGTRLTLNSGFMSMINGQVGVSQPTSLTLGEGITNFVADVDLVNEEMDRFVVTGRENPGTYGNHLGTLNVVGMNIINDKQEMPDSSEIYFAEVGLKDFVQSSITELPMNEYQNYEAYTPIYKYNYVYDNRDDGGYFMFTKGDRYYRPGQEPSSSPESGGSGFEEAPTGNPSDAFNPAVLPSPVMTQVAGKAVMTETFRYVFEHADTFTQLPEATRISKINANKYALSTNYNENLGSLNYHDYDENKGAWVRPYTTFEKINLQNGPDVNSITYGTLIGYDTDFRQLKHGWHNVGTAYLGYTGSHSTFKGVNTTMNGGLLGITESFYKGNFWTAITASVGAGVANTSTMYGKEDTAMLMAGVSSKTGYNFEFKEGRYILQPIMQMSYTMVNTFDYTNAAGVRIKSDPLHSLLLNPKLRFIMNTKNGWQPYLQVGMVSTVLNEANTTANNVQLPNMKIKPYAEYGIGVQRHWHDKYSAFGQVMVRNGGRTGVALTAGFRWALGREAQPCNEKVQNKPAKKILSQLDMNTKTVLKKQTTRTANQATVRPL